MPEKWAAECISGCRLPKQEKPSKRADGFLLFEDLCACLRGQFEMFNLPGKKLLGRRHSDLRHSVVEIPFDLVQINTLRQNPGLLDPAITEPLICQSSSLMSAGRCLSSTSLGLPLESPWGHCLSVRLHPRWEIQSLQNQNVIATQPLG